MPAVRLPTAATEFSDTATLALNDGTRSYGQQMQRSLVSASPRRSVLCSHSASDTPGSCSMIERARVVTLSIAVQAPRRRLLPVDHAAVT